MYESMNDDEDLRREVRRLRDDVDALRRRLEALEDAVDTGDSTDASVTEDLDAAANVNANANENGNSVLGSRSTLERVRDGSASAERDWESTIGIRWLGLAGALALVVGAVFFVRLAIEIGLLGPLGRVVAGTVGGAGLFAGGRYAAARQGYVRWGRIAAGAGLAIAYFSLYAAYGFEGYRAAIGTPLWAVLAALTSLVAATAVLSIRDGAPLVAGEAFLLGYVTATLSTEAATVALTPVYVLLLASGLVAVATVRPWSRLVVSSAFATYGVLGLWIRDLEPPAAAIGAAAVATVSIYLLGSGVLRRSDRVAERRYRAALVVLTAVNATAGALLLEISVRDAFPDAPVAGLGSIAIAAALAGAVAVTVRRPMPRENAAAAGAVVLLAAGLGMALEPFATTVAVLGVICAATAVSRAGGLPAVRIGAHIVAAGLVLKLLAVDATALPAFDAADPVATLTGRPVSFGLAVVVFYALARRFAADEAALTRVERGTGLPPVTALYATAGTGLAVLAFGLELSGVGISVAWTLFGFGLLGVGWGTDRSGARLLGIAVLGLATAKVFFFDTSELDTVARTISFLVLGAVLLTASYVYARSRNDLAVGLAAVDGESEGENERK